MVGKANGGYVMKWLRLIAVMFPILLLGACATPQAAPAPTPVAYPDGGQTFHLDVAQIEILRVTSPEAGNAIDMTDAVDSWLRRHLVAVGTSGRVQATINNAASGAALLWNSAN